MEQQLVKCLKAFATEILDGTECSIENTIDSFMERAELALSPSARQELINHLNEIIKQ